MTIYKITKTDIFKKNIKRNKVPIKDDLMLPIIWTDKDSATILLTE